MKAMSIDEMKAMPEPTDPDAKIPWCNKGYTVAESKEKCFIGCWKYRCFSSKLHDQWSEDRAKWRKKRYG